MSRQPVIPHALGGTWRRCAILIAGILIGAAYGGAALADSGRSVNIKGTARTFSGLVTRVSDGDTLWVQPDSTGQGARRYRKRVKVRLVGLDAPERCQVHGADATAALTAAVLHRHVTVRRRATDDYGRALGTLWLHGRDVGAWMVLEGHAWSSHYHDNPGPYAAEERAARIAHRGLFADDAAIEPWVFRHEHGPCETTVAPAIAR